MYTVAALLHVDCEVVLELSNRRVVPSFVMESMGCCGYCLWVFGCLVVGVREVCCS